MEGDFPTVKFKRVHKMRASGFVDSRIARGRVTSNKSQGVKFLKERYPQTISVPSTEHGEGVFIDCLQIIMGLFEDILFGDIVKAMKRQVEFFMKQPNVRAVFLLFDIAELVHAGKQQEQINRQRPEEDDQPVKPEDLIFACDKVVPKNITSLMHDRHGFRIPFLQWVIDEVELLLPTIVEKPKFAGITGPTPVLKTTDGLKMDMLHGEADIQAFYLARYFNFQSVEIVSTDSDTLYYGLLHTVWSKHWLRPSEYPELPTVVRREQSSWPEFESGWPNQEFQHEVLEPLPDEPHLESRINFPVVPAIETGARVIWSFNKHNLTWCLGRRPVPDYLWGELEQSRMDVTAFAQALAHDHISVETLTVAALIGGSDYTTGNMYLTHDKVFSALFKYWRDIGSLIDETTHDLRIENVRRLVTFAYFTMAHASRKNAPERRPTHEPRFIKRYEDLIDVVPEGKRGQLISTRTLNYRIQQLDMYWRIMRSLHEPKLPNLDPLKFGYEHNNGIYTRKF
jgi:hypothetical protein